MHLSRLRLYNFRNLAEQTLDIPPEGIAIVGDNGQGKTNLLEAVYYLEIFRSFRGAPDEQLVRFGEEVFRVEGTMTGAGEPRLLAAAFDRKGKRKKVTVHGAEPPRMGEAIGGVGAVIFSPTDVGIVSGSPAARRRFLDIVLSLAVPGYLEALQRFRQVLSHRNALLRQEAPAAVVGAWDEGLVAAGSRVTVARAEWIASRAESFTAHYADISGGPPGAVEYEPSVPLAGDVRLAVVEDAFRGELARFAERERRRGMTVVGPHRDDLVLRARGEAGEWVDLRVYGSGGQQRTAAVALRMVEAETIHETRERDPVILLDDVFAELDPGRSRRILEWIEREERGQVILTAPKDTDLEVRGGALPRWRIRSGVVSPL